MPTKVFFNSVVNWFISRRMEQIDHFRNTPHETQRGVLYSLISKASDTVYGQEYGFQSINSQMDFQDRVPLVNYENFEPWIERARQGEPNIIWPGQIRQFAKSSGTTNAKSKFIPITDESLQDCHYKAGKDLIAMYVDNHPDSALFQRKNLRLGGSAQIYEDFNTKFGDLSAILIENLPFWVEIINTPNRKISLLSEWETKLSAIIQQVKNEDVGSLTGVPSWMLVLLQRLLQETGHPCIDQLWPNLEVFFHGGISFRPYREQYHQLIGKDIRYYEIYNASEGFFGIQDQPESQELLLMLDYGIYYEFIPMSEYGKENPKVLSLEEVEKGTNYALVISTNGGLWRYIIGDTIQFTNLCPYRFQITGRTKHYINAFGEELMIDNVEKALERVCQKTETGIIDYTGAPIFMSEGKAGAHEWIFEFSTPPENLKEFTQLFDKELQSLNSDYEAKRYNDMTLRMPIIHTARPQLFYHWMAKRGKLGGQNKVPRLYNERDYLDPLLAMNKD